MKQKGWFLSRRLNIFKEDFLKNLTLFKKLKINFFSKVNKVDLAIFTHQFSAMIEAGLPLSKCLLVLSNETENQALKKVTIQIIYDIKSGTSLSDAFLKHPQVFSNFFINMVKSGEVAGILPAVLKRLSVHLEKEEDLRQKVSSAFAYPAVVGFVALGVIIFLLVFIVPVFGNVYKSLKLSLPMPTQLLIIASNFMVKYAWLLVILGGAVFYICARLMRNQKAGFLWDHFKFFMPVFGRLNRKVATARFARTLSSMISGGVPLIRSLDISQEAVNNRAAFRVIRALKNSASQGRTLGEVLQKQNIFPPLAVQMITTGEESGTLDAMLNKVADFLDDEIDHNIKRLVTRLEPALTFLLAALVGYIAISIYLPMFDILRSISRK